MREAQITPKVSKTPLTVQQVKAIREQYAAGRRPKLIIEEFRISYTALYKIIYFKTHRIAE